MINTSFRARLLLLTILLGALPVLASSLFITLRTEQALVWEKQQKLFGITRILDQYLIGTYDDIIVSSGKESLNRQESVALLNKALLKHTDEIASAYPGIGVGYYSKSLDAIILWAVEYLRAYGGNSDQSGSSGQIGHGRGCRSCSGRVVGSRKNHECHASHRA